jgi:hypothetical protein
MEKGGEAASIRVTYLVIREAEKAAILIVVGGIFA